MKILIEGDMNEKQLTRIGKLLVKMYRVKKEHINVMVLSGTEYKSVEEVNKLLREMWKW